MRAYKQAGELVDDASEQSQRRLRNGHPPSAFESFSYDVTIPFIKNTVKILADEELILKHAFTPKKGRATRDPKGSSWVDHLNIRAAKKQKIQSP